MRIISGKYRGKRLVAPKKLPVRPTTDMAKEGLFNILNNKFFFDELKVLDLFAGTGNISYEFASRGSRDVTAVDGHSACISYIAKTSKELELGIKTIKADVFKFLRGNDLKFDIIFCDPPYNFMLDDFQKIVELVFDEKLLNEDGLLIIEHASQTDLSKLFHFQEGRKYGGSTFSFFEW